MREMAQRFNLAVQIIQGADVTSSRELFELLRNGQTETESGAVVSPDTAMRISSFYACVRVLAESLAQVPCGLFKGTETDKTQDLEHPVSRLISKAPNDFQTSFEFFELLMLFLCVRGNGYALKTVVRGEVRELLPINPDRVVPKQDDKWNVLYQVNMPDGSLLDVPPERMLHIPGMGFNGVLGMSPMTFHRETLGVAIQLTRHTSRIFRNGAHVGGVIEHPARLSPEAYQRLRESFDDKYSGVSNAHKTLLLEEGTKFNAAGSMNSKDAQYLETRKFTRSEIASIFRIPPHMIGDLERSTNNNIEQQALEFVMYTMMPWYRRFEQRFWKQLLTKAEQKEYFFKFQATELLKGDIRSRYTAYNIAILSGWLNRNEIRSVEGWNKGPADLDEFFTPVNMIDPSNPDAGTNNNPPDKGAKE